MARWRRSEPPVVPRFEIAWGLLALFFPAVERALFFRPVFAPPLPFLITTPTLNTSYDAGVSPITLGGIAWDSTGISYITWFNETTGGTGSATFTETSVPPAPTDTPNWIADVPLENGSNLIRVTATDPAGNASTLILIVTFRSSLADVTPPIVDTVVPTTGTNFGTGTAPIGLAGFAADNIEVATVVWANPTTGDSGTATGKTTWDAMVPLIAGSNVVVVTAYDTSGNLAFKILSVAFSIPPPPPDNTKAGHCGATGAEFLIPVGLLWLWRRRRRHR